MHLDFILYLDHDSSQHLQSQKHFCAKHARWVDYLQQFSFVLKHKVRFENRVVDALNRKVVMLNILAMTTIGLELIRFEYDKDLKMDPIYAAPMASSSTTYPDYSLNDGYLFLHTHLCLPSTNMREFMPKELHSEGIAGYFGYDKTIKMMEDNFY